MRERRAGWWQDDGRMWIGAGMALLGLGLGIVSTASARAQAAKSALQPVPALDLRRYAGEWFEVARYPNRFQRRCARRVTAQYEYPRHGTDATKAGVVNRCERADGREDVVRGWAKRASAQAEDGRLTVTFFWPFFGDYWVFGLDPEYRWALVGEPKRRYLWVLSRTPVLSNETWAEIEGRVRAAGFAPERLVRTEQ